MSKRVPILENNVVINVIMLDDGAEWEPPPGQVIGQQGGEIGDTWDGSTYVKPAPPDLPSE